MPLRNKILTQQQIDLLAASFYPTILTYYQSEEGKAAYQKYLDEKAKKEATEEKGKGKVSPM